MVFQPGRRPALILFPQSSIGTAVMQNPAVAHTYLTVAFKDKGAAKALGARWDGVQRQWYVPEGRELAPFAQWLSIMSTEVNARSSLLNLACVPTYRQHLSTQQICCLKLVMESLQAI